jgi:hypothetical protein
MAVPFVAGSGHGPALGLLIGRFENDDGARKWRATGRTDELQASLHVANLRCQGDIVMLPARVHAGRQQAHDRGTEP